MLSVPLRAEACPCRGDAQGKVRECRDQLPGPGLQHLGQVEDGMQEQRDSDYERKGAVEVPVLERLRGGGKNITMSTTTSKSGIALRMIRCQHSSFTCIP